MRLTKQHITLYAICLIAGIIMGAGMRSCSLREKPQKEPAGQIIVHDTITRTDTLIETHTRILRMDSVAYVYVRDTTRDTIYLPIEHKEYKDSIVTDSSRIAWRVNYHGHQSEIDTFNIDFNFKTTTRTEIKKKGWGQFIGIGIGAGYGISVIDRAAYASPEAGLHITYGWGYHW